MIKSGNINSELLILGEAPGEQEIAQKRPFVGPSGQLLDNLLTQVGLNRQSAFVTNVTSERPPANDISEFFYKRAIAKVVGVKEVLGRYPYDQIVRGLKDLDEVVAEQKPKITIAVGGTALWAATGLEGIEKWRGSILPARWGGWVIPTYHPAYVLRQYDLKYILEADLKRAKRLYEGRIEKPLYTFKIKPSFEDTIAWLKAVPDGADLIIDIETRLNQISCVGFGLDETRALCIPLMSMDGSYFSIEEEIQVIQAMKEVCLNPTIKCVFHNALFDTQYFAEQFGFIPFNIEDTMIMQAVCFPGESKSLDFCASMYSNHYTYWKDDGKFWDPTKMPIEQHWFYNCEDLSYTYRVYRGLQDFIDKFNLRKQYEFELSLVKPVLKMMLRGIAYNSPKKETLFAECDKAMSVILNEIEAICGHPLNPRSTPQMKALFYQDFGCQKILHRKTRQPTLDDDALLTIRRKNPLLRPLLERISNYRSLSVFKSTFLGAKTSEDGRMRCSFNVVGTKTFRFSSSANIKGTGLNLENIPKGDD